MRNLVAHLLAIATLQNLSPSNGAISCRSGNSSSKIMRSYCPLMGANLVKSAAPPTFFVVPYCGYESSEQTSKSFKSGPILVVAAFDFSFLRTDRMKNFVQLVLSVPAVIVCVIVFVAMRKDGLLLLLGVPTTDHEVSKGQQSMAIVLASTSDSKVSEMKGRVCQETAVKRKQLISIRSSHPWLRALRLP